MDMRRLCHLLCVFAAAAPALCHATWVETQFWEHATQIIVSFETGAIHNTEHPLASVSGMFSISLRDSVIVVQDDPSATSPRWRPGYETLKFSEVTTFIWYRNVTVAPRRRLWVDVTVDDLSGINSWFAIGGQSARKWRDRRLQSFSSATDRSVRLQ